MAQKLWKINWFRTMIKWALKKFYHRPLTTAVFKCPCQRVKYTWDQIMTGPMQLASLVGRRFHRARRKHRSRMF
jgi:hypothetical protein